MLIMGFLFLSLYFVCAIYIDFNTLTLYNTTMFASIRTVKDLIQMRRDDAEIRRQRKHALFLGIDLEKALQELAETIMTPKN